MTNIKVGDLVHCGFGVGIILNVDYFGNCKVHWCIDNRSSLRTDFRYEEIEEFRKRLGEEIFD
jgi:hypothetical protein